MEPIHFVDGGWQSGNPKIAGPMDHVMWMASTVFDGARAFEGVTPDLDQHCQRLVDSANSFGLKPVLTAPEILELALDGISRFDRGADLYVRPMFFAESGFVVADPETTRFCLSVYEAPMPEPKGLAVTLSSMRRPAPNMAPTRAKASCLYPASGMALKEAMEQGFDNAVVLDGIGNVAELATANVWMVKDGEAHTPIPNGTFLNGVTRRRVAGLLQKAGITVRERTITYPELLEADELFTTGNYGKVMPITRIEQRNLQPGPVYAKARELYWAYAHGDA